MCTGLLSPVTSANPSISAWVTRLVNVACCPTVNWSIERPGG
jgi:hypothetical protein